MQISLSVSREIPTIFSTTYYLLFTIRKGKALHAGNVTKAGFVLGLCSRAGPVARPWRTYYKVVIYVAAVLLYTLRMCTHSTSLAKSLYREVKHAIQNSHAKHVCGSYRSCCRSVRTRWKARESSVD